jgi:hypothetical protein
LFEDGKGGRKKIRHGGVFVLSTGGLNGCSQLFPYQRSTLMR